MKNLQDFAIPRQQTGCLCEIDGRTYFADDSHENLNVLKLVIETHPVIHITTDLIHPMSSGDEFRSLFLDADVPFLKQLTQVYYEHGLLEAIQTASNHKHFVISKLAHSILKVINTFQKAKLFINPNIQYRGVATITEYNQTYKWGTYSVKCLSWNPYSCMIAVATVDDSVRIYSSGSTSNLLLRYKQQRNVTCIAWRPLTNGELAVGHEDGIIVWNIDPHSLVARPSISNATLLYRVGHKPIMSIAWNPTGDVLVSVAALDKSIYVWNVELDKTSALEKTGGSGNTLVIWSPNGEKMFTATNGIVFRVWDCRTWESEKWTVLSGRVQSACWTSCGTHLIFATTTEPLIYALRVKRNVIFASDAECSNDQAFPLYDLSRIEINGVCVGGLVQTIVTDPKGNHLAVLFQNTNAIALFNIAKKHDLELIASSLIMECGEVPVTMAFQENFESGACLSIGWSNGKVQHFPIIYSDLCDSLSKTSNFNINRTYQSYNSF